MMSTIVDTKEKFVDRWIAGIEKLRIENDLSQKEMADILELSLSGYRKMISGETIRIDLFQAYKLFHRFGTFVFEILGVDLPEMSPLIKFNSLRPQAKNFVSGIIDFEYSFAPDPDGTEHKITVLIPTGEVVDGMIWDSCNLEKVDISSNPLKDFVDCGIKIISDHLHPVYNNGDILLISKQPPRTNQTAVFANRKTGRAYIRRMVPHGDICELRPLNHYGNTIEINLGKPEGKDWICFGVVVSKMR